MKRNVKMLLLALAGAVVLTSCNPNYGKPETRTFPLTEEYDELEIHHAFDVVMSPAFTEAKFTIPEQLYDKLVFEVKNGRLTVSFGNNFMSGIACTFEGKTDNNCPSQNTDIVSMCQGVDWIVDDIHYDILQDFNDT